MSRSAPWRRPIMRPHRLGSDGGAFQRIQRYVQIWAVLADALAGAQCFRPLFADYDGTLYRKAVQGA